MTFWIIYIEHVMMLLQSIITFYKNLMDFRTFHPFCNHVYRKECFTTQGGVYVECLNLSNCFSLTLFCQGGGTLNGPSLAKLASMLQGISFEWPQIVDISHLPLYSAPPLLCHSGFCPFSMWNLHQIWNPMTVLKSARHEDSETPPTCSIWWSFGWDIWG